jgi:hypothetical protein
MTAALLPLMIVAAFGFLLSVAAHLSAILGAPIPGGEGVWLLHVGIFVVWLPSVYFMRASTRDQNRKRVLQRLMSVYPTWVRWAAGALAVYVFASFFVLTSQAQSPRHSRLIITPLQIRIFSGHWMIFYGAAFLILYATRRSPQWVAGQQCPNGHSVPSSDRSCPLCGAEIQ